MYITVLRPSVHWLHSTDRSFACASCKTREENGQQSIQSWPGVWVRRLLLPVIVVCCCPSNLVGCVTYHALSVLLILEFCFDINHALHAIKSCAKPVQTVATRKRVAGLQGTRSRLSLNVTQCVYLCFWPSLSMHTHAHKEEAGNPPFLDQMRCSCSLCPYGTAMGVVHKAVVRLMNPTMTESPSDRKSLDGIPQAESTGVGPVTLRCFQRELYNFWSERLLGA